LKKFLDIKTILLKEEFLDYKIAQRILKNAIDLSIKLIYYTDEVHLGIILEEMKLKYKSKEVLILKEFLGRKFQKCPGSPNVICCNYYLLNTCFNCLFDCTYCFLNSYLNSFGIVQFVNLDELAQTVNEFSLTYPHLLRVGTGEFTDSLMFDEYTGIAKDLIKETSSNKKIFLEFKTKSENIDHLLDIKEKGNTVLAWTLNTPHAINLYEHGAASLDERLKAAKNAQDSGFFTAFHFDPIIKYNNFLDEYFEVIEKMHSILKADSVVWISLGCFRHSPGFKDIIKHKFLEERLTTEEMFPGIDGKMRYLTQDRIYIFKAFTERLKKYFPYTFIYLCMEDSYVWREVFAVDYQKSEDLEIDFSSHLEKFYS